MNTKIKPTKNPISAKSLKALAEAVEPAARKTKPRNNRSAGHDYECTCARELRAIGFDHVVTSRSESKTRDNAKVDLMNKDEGANGRLPYNIQCKNTNGTLSYHRLLAEMPSQKASPGVKNVLFHKQTAMNGGKFRPVGEYAIMGKKDFLTLAAELRVFGLQHEELVKENNRLREEVAALKSQPTANIRHVKQQERIQ